MCVDLIKGFYFVIKWIILGVIARIMAYVHILCFLLFDAVWCCLMVHNVLDSFYSWIFIAKILINGVLWSLCYFMLFIQCYVLITFEMICACCS